MDLNGVRSPTYCNLTGHAVTGRPISGEHLV
jgi:hypothetical protein